MGAVSAGKEETKGDGGVAQGKRFVNRVEKQRFLARFGARKCKLSAEYKELHPGEGRAITRKQKHGCAWG